MQYLKLNIITQKMHSEIKMHHCFICPWLFQIFFKKMFKFYDVSRLKTPEKCPRLNIYPKYKDFRISLKWMESRYNHTCPKAIQDLWNAAQDIRTGETNRCQTPAFEFHYMQRRVNKYELLILKKKTPSIRQICVNMFVLSSGKIMQSRQSKATCLATGIAYNQKHL